MGLFNVAALTASRIAWLGAGAGPLFRALVICSYSQRVKVCTWGLAALRYSSALMALKKRLSSFGAG